MSCPSGVELERGFARSDPSVQAHVEACGHCRAEWRSIAELRGLAAKLGRDAGPVDAREQLRAVLTMGSPRPRRASLGRVGVAVAAAVLVLVGTWVGLEMASSAPSRVASSARGIIRDLDGARFWSSSAQPDEVVRLVEGSLGIEVEPLSASERFRVVTADAEVEVRGTAFEVTAHEDRLELVWVIAGRVEVRTSGGTVILLAGERWRATQPPSTRAAWPAPRSAVAPAPLAAARAGVEAERAPRLLGPRSATAAATAAATASASASRSTGLDVVAFTAGWSALTRGDFVTAAQRFTEALASTSDPDIREDAAYYLGVSWARAERPLEAIAALERFLEAHPGSVRAGDAAAMLGWLLYDRGERARAQAAFARALESSSPRAVRSATDGLRALRRP